MPKHTVTSYTPPNSKTVAAKVRRDCCEPYGGRTRTRPSVRLPKVWWSYSNSRYKCASSPTTWLPATSTHCVHYWSMETAKQRMDASSEVASIFALSHAPSPPSGQPPSNAPPSPPLLQISVLHHVQYRKRILSVIRQALTRLPPLLDAHFKRLHHRVASVVAAVVWGERQQCSKRSTVDPASVDCNLHQPGVDLIATFRVAF